MCSTSGFNIRLKMEVLIKANDIILQENVGYYAEICFNITLWYYVNVSRNYVILYKVYCNSVFNKF